MSKNNLIPDSEGVTAQIQKLEPEFARIVESVRQLILTTSEEIAEQIKWNSPSFFYAGEMKPFDPKEYKRDIVVMNLRKGKVLLVFPTGAVIEDSSGVLEGNYSDGRRLASFNSMEDVALKGENLQKAILQWLSLIDK